jgi:bacterioferritin-associated ferredoxin
MIVCICKALTDRQIDAAVEAGAHTAEALAEATGAGTDCGFCQSALEARVQRVCARLASGACAGCADSLASAG